jgi:hypothetical protein
MDIDIDNYSNNEILELLRIEKAECTDERLLGEVTGAITKVRNSELDNKDDIEDFFKKCYMRVAVAKGFDITETVRATLGLPAQPVIVERHVTEADENQVVTERKLYPGALPAPDPLKYAINTVSSEYARGINDPVRRDSVTYTLVLSSKFRTNLNDATLTRSQGDRLRLRTYCATTNYRLKNIRETIFRDASGCPVIENNASRGLTTDFTVELDEPYDNVIALKVSGLEFMNTRYNVTEALGTNTFRIGAYEVNSTTGVPAGAPQWETFTLPEGDYNILDLVTPITGAINVVLQAATNVINRNVEVYLDTANLKKVIFRVNPAAPPPATPGNIWAFDMDFRLEKDPGRAAYLNLGWMLGFRKDQYTFALDYNLIPSTSAAIGYNAEAIANTAQPGFYLLEVNDYNNNNPTVVDYNCNSQYSFNIRNIIAKVPNTSSFDSVIFEDSSDRIWKTRNYFGPVRIKKLTVRLLDDVGRVVDTNDGDFTVTLEVITLNMPYKNMTR